MKKKLAIIISSVIIAIAVIGASVFAYATENTKKNSIGIDKALNIAMVDAGVLEQDIDVTKAKMEFEKGTFAYDIEFDTKDNYEYEYLIKATDGTILHKAREYDAEDADNYDDKSSVQSSTEVTTAQPTTESQAPTEGTTAQSTNSANSGTEKTTQAPISTQAPTTSSGISLDEAKKIALQKAGLSKNDVTFIHAHKDSDDGVAYYDIEFKTSSYEYEYEIDLNGKVISWDKDRIESPNHKDADDEDEDEDDDEDEDEDDDDEEDEDENSNSTNAAKYIGVDKAKQIALSHAGLSSGNVKFTKAKFERDDGISQYEIEFETSTTEYEYEIDAVSGKIISRSSEPIDD
ncbi:MAG: PepSY domain-containing protein [Eubacterium sp.]